MSYTIKPPYGGYGHERVNKILVYRIWGFFMPLNFHEFHELFLIYEIKFVEML